MAYKDLRDFIHALEKEGELVRITAEVNRDLEITEITDRVSKEKGAKNKALLFENVKGYKTPILTNMMGSEKRMAMALGVKSLDEIGDRITDLLDPSALFPPPGAGLMDKLKTLPKLAELTHIFPKTVTHAPCQEVVLTGDDIDLEQIPVLKCWPDDGGRFITLPMVCTRDPIMGITNVGMYRIQIFDKKSTGMHWHMHKDGARQYKFYEGAGKRMEAAIAIGGDPATIFSASAPLPPVVGELLFSGFLRNKPVEVVQAKTVDIKVPAHAEYIIEGYVEPGERRIEGPFGDHTGYYSLADQYPVFHVTAITHRKHPIYPATIVGRPPQEDAWMGKATERIFLPLLQMVAPEVLDYDMPVEGGFHNCIIIKIKKRYPGHARKVMNTIWGTGLMMLSKMIIVVDEDVNIHDYSELAWKVMNHVDPKRDMVFMEGPLDVLDHASPLLGYGSKVGIDATHKWKEEGFQREWPDEIIMSKEVQELVEKRWKEYGF